MNSVVFLCAIKSRGALGSMIVTLFLLLLATIAITDFNNAYAVKFFTSGEKPFGASYDDWISKYWNWDFSLNNKVFNSKGNECLANNSSSMVMLLNTVSDSTLKQCNISSKQGIMIPMWIAWCDAGHNKMMLKNPNANGVQLDQELTDCARRVYNLGNIASEVMVDGHRVANLNVKLALDPLSGALNYNKNSMNNVTEFYSKGFTATIPPDSHQASQKPGTWRAGSQGWWVFLKPLPPGQHTIIYNIRVTPTGPLTSPGTSPHFADITYKLNVAK
ncbi:MAG: hypothetical protein WA631_17695 [Nitrososphaeraceae archaeon]